MGLYLVRSYTFLDPFQQYYFYEIGFIDATEEIAPHLIVPVFFLILKSSFLMIPLLTKSSWICFLGGQNLQFSDTFTKAILSINAYGFQVLFVLMHRITCLFFLQIQKFFQDVKFGLLRLFYTASYAIQKECAKKKICAL